VNDLIDWGVPWLTANWDKAVTWVLAIGGFFQLRAWVTRFERSYEKVADIQKSAFYSELDGMYSKLLQIAMEDPILRSPKPITDDDEALKRDYDPYPDYPTSTDHEKNEKFIRTLRYDAYAYMVWNFLETIHDRCEQYPELRDTWATIVDAENQLHRGWFLKQMRDSWNHKRAGGRDCGKFCESFQVFVHDKNFLCDRNNGDYLNWSYIGREKFKQPPNFG